MTDGERRAGEGDAGAARAAAREPTREQTRGTGRGTGRAELRTPGRIPWVPVLVLAAIGTLAATAFTLYDLANTRSLNGWLIHVSADHPSRALVERELPDEPVSERGSHDGAQFYAIARSPFHLDVAAQSLDRPRYRLQRPVFPLLAYALHPTGGGEALVWSFFVVGVAGLFLGGVASGALSATLRGPPWPALVFPILPGALIALRITVPDELALGLVLAAITLSLRRHHRWAVVVAVVAVLTKEPMFFVLLGFGIWRRDRAGAALVAVPAVAAGAWAIWLRTQVAEGSGSFTDIVVPFTGLATSAGHWVQGDDPLSLIVVTGSVVLAVVALARRRLAHPLSWAIIINLAFLVVLGADSLGPERNGARTTFPLLMVSLLALVAPRGGRQGRDPGRGQGQGQHRGQDRGEDRGEDGGQDRSPQRVDEHGAPKPIGAELSTP